MRSVAGISLPVEIQLRGADIDQSDAASPSRCATGLRRTPGVLDPDVSVRSGKPEVRATMDRLRAAQFNVPPGLAGADPARLAGGQHGRCFPGQGGQEVQARSSHSRASWRPAARRSRRCRATSWSATTRRDSRSRWPMSRPHDAERGPANIERNNGQRVVYRHREPGARHAARQCAADRQKQILDATAPSRASTSTGAAMRKPSNENAIPFASALILAILLVYIVMASLFNSLGTPFVIMFTLPMALVGALGALVLTGETLSLVAAIGIIMLVGLMGRNAILLLDYTNTLRARGLERNDGA